MVGFELRLNVRERTLFHEYNSNHVPKDPEAGVSATTAPVHAREWRPLRNGLPQGEGPTSRPSTSQS